MNLICGAIQSLWNEFYNTCVRNLDSKTKMVIGLVALVVGLIVFVASVKNNKNPEFVNNWFLFWIAIILVLIGIFYLTQ